MKITTITAAVAVAVTTGAASAGGHLDRTGWPESFTVGTASQGGTFFAYGSGWANLVAEELGISGGAEVTGGPMQNMALVHTGDAAFGMTTMGPAAESLAGTNPIAPGLQMTGACAMFPMYQTPFSVTALASSGITSISEIPAGAKIGFGPAGSTSDTYFPRMMETLGVELRAPQRWLERPWRPASGRSSRRDRLRRRCPGPRRQPARGPDRREHHRVHRGRAGQDSGRLPGLGLRNRRQHLFDAGSGCALGLACGTSPSPIATCPKASSKRSWTSSCRTTRAW